jgi:hypothetical protein
MEIETSATSGWPEPPDSGQVLPLEPDSSILINGEAIIRTEASAEDAVMSSHASASPLCHSCGSARMSTSRSSLGYGAGGRQNMPEKLIEEGESEISSWRSSASRCVPH